MLNKITLMGRNTRDPELRYTTQNVPVTTFTLAVDRDYQPGGNKQTDFITCIAWRRTAEFVNEYFHKGDMVAVSGSLQTREYTDRDGNKRKVFEVVADNVYFCERKKNDAPAPSTTFEDLDDDEPLPN